jgi:LDH2 family malate/lactate/ureidoglycolate dehydrogenase
MITKVSQDDATRLCLGVFGSRMGAPSHIAQVAAKVLVDASLRGVDSHGITVLPYYIERWEGGQIVPGAEPEIVRESMGTAVVDAHQAIGHYASQWAVDIAVGKALQVGVGSVVVRNSTHNGTMGYYAIRAAEQELIGIATTACAPHVAPLGGAGGLHGTNPIAYALPREGGRALVFDVSTGYSSGKLERLAEQTGEIPEHCVVDSEGKPTTRGEDIKSGWILPVGGKIGYGFGLLVDALTGGLGDAPIGQQMRLVSDTSGPYEGCFHFLAISPDAFAGWSGFSDRINTLVNQIENIPPQDPESPVRWPGQRGWAEREKRLKEGIPIDAKEWERLQALFA